MATIKGMTLMDTHEVAARIGVKRTTVAIYLKDARARRARGEERVSDMPEPVRYFTNSPAWESEQIEAWIAARPGHGVAAEYVNPR